MSFTTPDFADAVIEALIAKGYTVCECDDGFWFTWARPDGRGDVEVGETYTDQLSAYLAALQHWLEATDIPFDEPPSAYLVTLVDSQYAVLDMDDIQLIDDCTNHNAVVEPLFTHSPKGT
jgi:hypothetical protein